MRQRDAVCRRALEQNVADQKERGAAEHGHDGLGVGVAGRMRQHELVGDGGDDDAGDDEDLDVGVGETREPAGIGRDRRCGGCRARRRC